MLFKFFTQVLPHKSARDPSSSKPDSPSLVDLWGNSSFISYSLALRCDTIARIKLQTNAKQRASHNISHGG